MVDFIEQPGAPQMQTPEQPQEQFIQEQPMQEQQPMQGGAMAGEGTHGAGIGAVQQNPMTEPEEGATAEEQQMYDDLFMRVMQSIHDTREQPNGNPSVADALINALSDPRRQPHEVIGGVAGLMMAQMIDMAKRQGMEYPGPVVQEVGMDATMELMRVADFSGAIKNMPEEDSPEFEKLFELSVLEAAKFFGEHQLQTGQANRNMHMKELQGQFQREAESGELDDWGMEQFDDQFRGAVSDEIKGRVEPA